MKKSWAKVGMDAVCVEVGLLMVLGGFSMKNGRKMNLSGFLKEADAA